MPLSTRCRLHEPNTPTTNLLGARRQEPTPPQTVTAAEPATRVALDDPGAQVGVYTNASTWRFHSYQAQTLLRGRKIMNSPDKSKPYEVPSLDHVGKRLNTIWAYARKDDPYAFAALIELERLLERANRVLQRYDSLVMKEVRNRTLPDGFSLGINASTKPLAITLNDSAYKTPHCKQLVLLIASFDDFVRKLTTFREFGLLTSVNAELYLFRTTRAIRAVFMESLRFHPTGVTRHDIFEDNSIAATAAEKMGVLPMDILRGERLPVWAQQGVFNQST